MRVTINYCGGCGKDCANTSIEDLFGSRTFFFKDTNSSSPDNYELTLCADGKKQFYLFAACRRALARVSKLSEGAEPDSIPAQKAAEGGMI